MTNRVPGDQDYIFDDNAYQKRYSYVPTGSTNITAVADLGGGEVQVTSADHGLAPNDVITISGTTSYNGDKLVKRIVDKDNFVIDETFVATETGSWVYLSANQGKLQYTGRALPGDAEGDLAWTILRAVYNSGGSKVSELMPSNVVGGPSTNRFIFSWASRSTYFYL